MAQWGQGQQGFQIPMQTGFPGANQQFPPQNPQFQQQNPQFQQPPQQQFQQGSLGIPQGGLLQQQTGFPGQRPGGFQQPQQTGFPGGSGFIQSQATGFAGGNFAQQGRPAPPPVPPIPSQFQQPNQPSFLNAPPPNRHLNVSPGFGGGGLLPQPTEFGGRPGGSGMLVPQMTGFTDPRLQMMSQTFMPMNTSAPYSPSGLPQLQPQPQNLVQSIQQHNQAQRGTTAQQMSWALTKAERKNYDNIFRSWDANSTGFINGTTALEVFGASGLAKDELARIWTLADINDRGKLNIAEFHVAMALIYRRLNGMPVPDQLPQELVPPSSADLNDSVDRVMELLKSDSRARSPSNFDNPQSLAKVRTFYGSSPAKDNSRDATVYKYSDAEPTGIYKPRSRHVDRDAIRSRDDDNSPSADLSDMKRQLANTASRLDRDAEDNALRTREDEELDREMDDLKYRVKRVQEDLDYNSRGPKSASKEEERRRLEREMLSLMHERIPEVERKIKAREERKEREKRQWARDRDRANDRFGRYDSRDDYSRRDDRDRDRPYSRGDDRDRPYSRGDDRDRTHSRGGDDRDRAYSRGAYDHDDRDRDSYRRDRSRERGYDRPRSPPTVTRSPPPPPPAAPPASAIRDPPAAPVPKSTPSPALKSMSPAERQAFARAEAQRRIQARMAALGVTAPGSPTVDTSVEDRLQQEKKEAEEKAKAAEKQAEERERARKERLEGEKALKEGRTTPAPPAPTPTKTAAPPAPTPKVAPAPLAPVPTPKSAPPPPKSRAPAPPPPRNKAPAPRAPPIQTRAAPAPVVPPPAPVPEPEPEIDRHEEMLRAREETLRKQREEREAKFQARLRELERQEEEAAREEEARFQARLEAMKKSKAAKSPSPPPAPVPAIVQAPPAPAPPAPPAPALPAPALPPVSPPAAEKSTNPFSRLIKEGGSSVPASPSTNGTTANPWAKPATSPSPSVPPPSKSPAPNAVKTSYQTVPSAIEDDWDDIKENDDSDDSSDDEITQSRSARANIAQQLFGSMLPRPTSGAASGPASSPSSPAPSGAAPPAPAPPPPPAPPAPAAPRALAVAAPIAAPAGTQDVSALMQSIQGGKKLKPTKTIDKSIAQVGKVLGDTAPPAHINANHVARGPSPPPPAPPASVAPVFPDTAPMVNNDASRSSNRQSVGWFADRAADVGGSPVIVERLPSMSESDEADDIYETPSSTIPEIRVGDVVPEAAGNSLMSDIDKGKEHRVRSMFPFEGDGPEDLSFGENLMIVANPSKTGGEWWYGTLVNTGQAGLFPKTFVEIVTPKKAKAVYTYTGNNPDELPFTEGDVLSIIDTSEEEWWKAEQGGVVFIVPAAYLELVEEVEHEQNRRLSAAESETFANSTTPTPTAAAFRREDEDPPPPTAKPATRTLFHPAEDPAGHCTPDVDADSSDSDDDSDSDSDYLSFSEADDETATASKEARERERQLVLEAAGLFVKQDVGPPPHPVRARSVKRRPAPAAPHPRRVPSVYKDLPPTPTEPEHEVEVSHEARLDDAFARYESFKNKHAQSNVNLNRLSVVSTDSTRSGPPVSPTATISSMGGLPMSSGSGSVSSSVHGKERTSVEGGRYSGFLNFLSRNKTPDGERRSASTLNISAPIMVTAPSSQSQAAASQDVASRSNSPSFGMSWASLVDKTALDGIPPGERRRQEAIFELINTEVAYVRDLQLIVEVFYSSMLPLLSMKEITVVFANIEDLLLTNTGFVSSLEERQKECRLYVDKIGDILLSHVPNMGVYMEYCVNQSIAIKVLKSLRDSNPELGSHLQRLRDENPTVRSLDLSSYLLAPMQRITRYPLLIKQILQYTEVGEEHEAIQSASDMSERLLDHINETIREQEGHEVLKKISQNLWIGQGRLDLTAPTRHMGMRRLLKQGVLLKTKSGKKLNAFLCSDILVLTDESAKNLYRMPIPLAHAEVKEAGRDETTFQISQAYPRGGESVSLRASSPRECQQWIQEIAHASKRSRQAEERGSRKAGRRS